MSESLSNLHGEPWRLKVPSLGREYLLHPLTIEDLSALEVWVNEQFPDPFAVVTAAIERGNYTMPQQQYLLKEAIQAATRPAHPLASPEAQQVLLSMAGIKRFFMLSIRKGDPTFSDEDAKELWLHIRDADLQAAFATTGLASVLADPKAGSGMSSENGTSTSRRTRGKASTGGTSTIRR
jgi:hypothetical protein